MSDKDGTHGGPITGFPAPGLTPQNRYVTGYNEEGKSVFLRSDNGDHGAIMVEGAAAQNIIYSTKESPVDVNGEDDIKFAQANKVCDSILEHSK